MKQLGFSSVGENLAKGLFDLMEKFLKFRINGWPVYKASSLLVHCPLISGEGGGVVEPQPPSTRRPTRNQNSFLNQTQTKSSQLKSIQVHQPTTQHQTKIYFFLQTSQHNSPLHDARVVVKRNLSTAFEIWQTIQVLSSPVLPIG